MPELPEVETMCRGISAITGREVTSVRTPTCKFRPIRIEPDIRSIGRRLRGRTVDRISRLGKRVVILTANDALVLQPKMSGLVALGDPPDAEHVRLQIDFAGYPKLRLLFWDRRGLGSVELVPREELQSRIVTGKLGPDALDISLAELSERLAATRRPIKVALLDQRLVAGIGNLYASEILHAARIHPATESARLRPDQVARVHESIHSILSKAIEYEGSTLSDGTYRNALNAAGQYQCQHRVYDRASLVCATCGKGKIERIVQSQRSTFFCPYCQDQKSKQRIRLADRR